MLLNLALFVMGLKSNCKSDAEFRSRFAQEIGWFLLPESILMFGVSEQTSHFCTSPNGKNVSWMVFPSEEVLRELNVDDVRKGNVLKIHHIYDEKNLLTPNCLEKINLQEFEKRSFNHKNFIPLRKHLILDKTFYEYISNNLIGHNSNRYWFLSNIEKEYTVKEINAETRKLEKVAYLYIVGSIYENYGILLDQKWINECINYLEAYPEFLADYTAGELKLPRFVDQNIKKYNFAIGDRCVFGVERHELSEKIDEMLSRMYVAILPL